MKIFNKKTSLISLIILLLLIASCSSNSNGSSNIIDSVSLIQSSEESDKIYLNETVTKLKEKYTRHFQNGLYFEELSKEKQELNDMFYKKFNDLIKENLEQKEIRLKNSPYIFKTKVEFVNEDVKKYSQGKLKAEDIISNPDSIMSIEMQYYVFVTQEELKKKDFGLEYIRMQRFNIAKELYYNYMQKGVEFVEYWTTLYDIAALEEFPLEKLKDEKYIQPLIGKKYEIFDTESYLKAPYYNTYISDIYFEQEMAVTDTHIWGGDMKDTIKRLNEKYKIPFVVKAGQWYEAMQYPELFFRVERLNNINNQFQQEDHFLSTFYQYLLTQKIKELIKKLGLEKDVIFLVTTEPNDDIYREEHASVKPYDFSKFDEEHFLKKGYEGEVYFTIIYLFEVSKEELKEIDENIRKSEEYIRQNPDQVAKTKYIRPKPIKKGEFKKIDELAKGINEIIDIKGHIKEGRRGFKDGHVYDCYVGEYEKKVLLDLFNKQEITERTRRPELELYEVYSDRYRTRAETQGFHYLDIFARSLVLQGTIGIDEFSDDRLY